MALASFSIDIRAATGDGSRMGDKERIHSGGAFRSEEGPDEWCSRFSNDR